MPSLATIKRNNAKNDNKRILEKYQDVLKYAIRYQKIDNDILDKYSHELNTFTFKHLEAIRQLNARITSNKFYQIISHISNTPDNDIVLSDLFDCATNELKSSLQNYKKKQLTTLAKKS